MLNIYSQNDWTCIRLPSTNSTTYPCTCTRREIKEAAQHSAGAPHAPEPVYPGTCRARCRDGRPAAVRWQVPDQISCVTDGWTHQTVCQHLPSEVGDFVLQRSDGVYAYHLAVVVDDAAMGVSDIVRGEDLLISTPRQAALQRALGFPTPQYFHVPLMTDFHGERLAKRGGAPSLAGLRQGGASAERVLSELARSLGWAVPPEVTAETLLPVYLAFTENKTGQPKRPLISPPAP